MKTRRISTNYKIKYKVTYFCDHSLQAAILNDKCIHNKITTFFKRKRINYEVENILDSAEETKMNPNSKLDYIH